MTHVREQLAAAPSFSPWQQEEEQSKNVKEEKAKGQ